MVPGVLFSIMEFVFQNQNDGFAFRWIGITADQSEKPFHESYNRKQNQKMTAANNTMAIPSPVVVSAIHIISGSEIRKQIHLWGVRLGHRRLVGVLGFGPLLLRLGFHGVEFEVGENGLGAFDDGLW